MKRKAQPPEKTPSQRVSEDFGRFVYGKYVVGETAISDSEIAFDCNGEALVSVRVYEDRYDMILDGEVFPVADLEAWEAVKKMILVKKEPDRIPFPKETAVYSRCGMRCDLCVHYTGGAISEEFREELKRLVAHRHQNHQRPQPEAIAGRRRANRRRGQQDHGQAEQIHQRQRRGVFLR